MKFFKKNKKYYSKIKWTLLFTKNFFKSAKVQKFYARYTVDERSVDFLTDQIRKLLKLNPSWILGHFYYSLLSFRKFQYSKQPASKGAMRLGYQALKELGAPHYIVQIANAFNEFTLKNFDIVISELDKLYDSQAVPKYIRYIAIELLAATYMITETKEKALELLEFIPVKDRSEEVSSMVHLIKSSHSEVL